MMLVSRGVQWSGTVGPFGWTCPNGSGLGGVTFEGAGRSWRRLFWRVSRGPSPRIARPAPLVPRPRAVLAVGLPARWGPRG